MKRKPIRFASLVLAIGLAALFGSVLIASALTKTWSGLGVNDNWSTGGNWAGGVAPSPGDDLVFPAGAARLTNTNNLVANTAFNSITFTGTGYTLRGSSILLAGGVSSANSSGANLVQFPIQLTASQTFTNSNTGSLYFNVSQTFNLNGHNATFGVANGEIQMADSVIGAGTVIKTGVGSLTWGNIGAYSGVTEVREGSVWLTHSSLGSTSGETVVFSGATLRISGGMNTINIAEPLTLAGSLMSGGTFNGINGTIWSGPIQLTAPDVTFEISGKPLAVDNTISGTGSLTKFSSQSLTLNANNTYTGSTTNLSGALFINGSQPQSPVFLFGGTLSGGGTCGHITAVPGSAKIINPGFNTAGALTCSNVFLNESTTFTAELNGATSGTYDQLRVRGTVTLSNPALNVVLGFVPSPGQTFTIITNDGVDAVVGTFNGLPEGTTFSVGTNQFGISYIGGTGNDVVLTRVNLLSTGLTRVWTGNGANRLWTTAANWSNNITAGPGDDLLFPPGAAQLTTSNNFPAGTIFNSITISGGNYFHYGANLLLNAGINATNTTTANTIALPITLNANQAFVSGNANVNLYLSEPIDITGKVLTLAGNGFHQMGGVISGGGGLEKIGTGNVLVYGSNTFSGPVTISQGILRAYHGNSLGSSNSATTVSAGGMLSFANTLVVSEPVVLAGSLQGSDFGTTLNGPITLVGSSATLFGPLTVNGVMSGSGGFTMGGSEIVLNADNDYSGGTLLNSGALTVNGSQPSSPIVFDGSTTLRGSGRVGAITTSSPGGILNPGTFGAAILSSSNVTLGSSLAFVAEMFGPVAGTEHDQLNVSGTVNLVNVNLIPYAGFAPAPGSSFIILNNDGADGVNGIFNGFPEGTVFTNNGVALRITYTGGDGNDVVLTRVAPEFGFASITRLGNGHSQLQGTGGVSGFSYTIEAATNLNPIIQWSNIGSAVANPEGSFSFTDTNAPLFLNRFYRALLP